MRIDFQFSQKHIDYIRRCRSAVINVAEGAVRAGKTIDNLFAFASELERTPDRLHLASGVTLSSAKTNLSDANGFGLSHLFYGRCRAGRFEGNDCLYIKTKMGERVVIFAGCGKADSYKKIRGNSFGLWIATEINLHHESAVKEAMNRQLAAKNRRIFWDLNPESPDAPIYTDYLDRFAADLADCSYNYGHFTIRDNRAVSKARLLEIEAQYRRGSVWYRRDILGERCAAEGLVYPELSEEPARFLIGETPKIKAASIGVDFGGNGSAHAFTLVGFTPGFSSAVVLDEYYRKEIISPADLAADFCEFVGRAAVKYRVAECRCDSAEPVLIEGLKRAAAAARIPVPIHRARKGRIHDRIRFLQTMLAEDRFLFSRACPISFAAFQKTVFDKDGRRLDDGRRNIDSIDSAEYALEPYMKPLLAAAGTRKGE